MTDRWMNSAWMALLAALLWVPPVGLVAETWSPPSYQEVRGEVAEWVQANLESEAQRQQVLAHWPEQPAEPAAGAQLLEKLGTSLAEIDPQIAALREIWSRASVPGQLPDTDAFATGAYPPRLAASLRLRVGQWLTQEGHYDEALRWLERLRPEEVIDPATLLFCRAVAFHRIVRLESSQNDLETLLLRAESIPQRYADVARLMRDDLAVVEEESLDHISRRMDDIARRLDKGHANDKLIKIEDGVVESLDKLIKRLEEQAQQQQQQQQQGGGAQAARPMDDSMPAQQQGPGLVDPRDIGSRAGWGDLPDKQREAALQQVGREYPAHYRDVIQQYFRRLAGDE